MYIIEWGLTAEDLGGNKVFFFIKTAKAYSFKGGLLFFFAIVRKWWEAKTNFLRYYKKFLSMDA